MSLDKLKLNKQLVTAMTDAGFETPKQVQEKVMSRILGGQDLIVSAPEGSGKTTAYVLAVLFKLKYASEDTPRVLVLVPSAEKIDEVVARFELLNRSSLRIAGLQPTGGIQSQINLIANGCDVVVTTPDRARAIYLKSGLNVNRLQQLIIDDADLMIKRGMQLPITELATSITKCQRLVCTDVYHDKLGKLIEPFMNAAASMIEVNELPEENQLQTVEQILYQVPNYKTKLNLLNFLMRDDEYFTKVVVFVNSRFNAQKLYKSLNRRLNGEVALLKPMFFDLTGFKTIEEFKASATVRILVVANEGLEEVALNEIPFVLHFDLPDTIDAYVERVTKRDATAEGEVLSITFSTDTELSQVRRIEQVTGKQMEPFELPLGVIIENSASKEKAAKKKAEETEMEGMRGKAFHEKKAKNAKDYNFSSKEKAKMKYKKR
ncbi:DEAD/DEAH box helicase [Solitalea lacus]|uniref:DEAD/DEAH box helicase n=1 Tax=Solitalea lacus TaxID=2911172 RepID=UPI001EDA4DF9|nr:DEAD/DEAH box helicase [Solitalea lacus]UKJ06828.1 DEAD/DEAH box helicase [Solitalea lacus]